MPTTDNNDSEGNTPEQGDQLSAEVLEFLEQHCEALQTGDAISIPPGLLEKHSELRELVDCMNMLESLASSPVSDVHATRDGSGGSFSSSMMQQLPREFGSFCLEEELGRGGMGVVYKARHRTLDTHYALKMIRASEFASDEEVRRFYQEARAASRLRHPNIVSVHDAGEQDGLPFLVMTYIEGRTLADHFQDGHAKIDTTVTHIIQIARAVGYLHQQGIIHRDLKPANILIDETQTAFVTDFGLAKVFEGDGERTMSGTILGTPAYMAPEQAWGKPDDISSQCDIYSLGAILYQLLTGRPPYDEESPLDQMLRLRDSEPKLPSKLNPDVPSSLEKICMRCLEKKPENRYQVAEEFADDLERFQHGEPITLQSLGLWARLRRWTRREPALFVHLAAFLVIAIIVQIAEWSSTTRRDSYAPVMTILVIWAAISFLFQYLMTREFMFSRRTWIACDAALFTAAVANAQGPIESLVTGYALLIVASSMWYRPKLVAVTTGASVVSYSVLLAYRGAADTPPHYPYLVVGLLLVIGGIVTSLVRRIRQLLAVRSRL